MRKRIKLISAVLIGISVLGNLQINHTASSEAVEKVNIKLQGNLESLVRLKNYPKYKNSSNVAVAIYYYNPISGDDIAALHRCQAQIPFGGIDNQNRVVYAGVRPSMEFIEQCVENPNVLFMMPNYQP